MADLKLGSVPRKAVCERTNTSKRYAYIARWVEGGKPSPDQAETKLAECPLESQVHPVPASWLRRASARLLSSRARVRGTPVEQRFVSLRNGDEVDQLREQNAQLVIDQEGVQIIICHTEAFEL